MYHRLKVLLKEKPNERFFGQFGRCHISMNPSNLDCGWYNYKSVLNQTITDLFGSADSVVNIGYLYTGVVVVNAGMVNSGLNRFSSRREALQYMVNHLFHRGVVIRRKIVAGAVGYNHAGRGTAVAHHFPEAI